MAPSKCTISTQIVQRGIRMSSKNTPTAIPVEIVSIAPPITFMIPIWLSNIVILLITPRELPSPRRIVSTFSILACVFSCCLHSATWYPLFVIHYCYLCRIACKKSNESYIHISGVGVHQKISFIFVVIRRCCACYFTRNI